eukprot:6116800-Karenia_brevis.AAC.1
MRKQGLDEHYPFEAWPPISAVEELAMKIKKTEKSRGVACFVFADIKKFLPAYCPDFVSVASNAQEEEDRKDVKDCL